MLNSRAGHFLFHARRPRYRLAQDPMQFPDTLAAGALMMTVVIVTAAFIGRHDRFYREDLARTANRRLPLDGLRGLAALMVVMYHAALSGSWLATGQWGGA